MSEVSESNRIPRLEAGRINRYATPRILSAEWDSNPRLMLSQDTATFIKDISFHRYLP